VALKPAPDDPDFFLTPKQDKTAKTETTAQQDKTDTTNAVDTFYTKHALTSANSERIREHLARKDNGDSKMVLRVNTNVKRAIESHAKLCGLTLSEYVERLLTDVAAQYLAQTGVRLE
jgi:predicted HicB family RNase H-like nuclease